MSYENIKKQCLQLGALFEDRDFPASASSIFFSKNPPRNWEWKRPKEICDNPEWISGGTNRLDVCQGQLGDCWLLAGLAPLTSNEKLIERVVPPEQSFTDGYCGIFRFNFWNQGEWQEVIVDDRLPTCNGQLVFMKSSEKNEFWSALLEKAYAKVNGSYEAIEGGHSSDAMEDFTGGLTEVFELQDKTPPDLFTIMMKATERSSLMGCSIKADPNVKESILPSGLVMGHAYSVTSVQMTKVKTSSLTDSIPMVRVRNPWGDETEWNGAWSDKSQEWSSTTPEEREKMGLVLQYDGEFWISFKDFTSNFHRLYICNLGPDSVRESDRKCWESYSENGKWVRNFSAGGSANNRDTYWANPQYRMTLTDPDDDEDNLSTAVIALLQKDMRKKYQKGATKLYIGFNIYKLTDPNTGRLDRETLESQKLVGSSKFISLREVSGRFKLEPGTYIIIPFTSLKEQEGEFLLRVFTEKENQSSVVDEKSQYLGQNLRAELRLWTDTLKENFKQIAGEDMEIDAYELLVALNPHFIKEFSFPGFTIDTCHSMVAMHDEDLSGKLKYAEFKELCDDLQCWKEVFKNEDTDMDGHLSTLQLRSALQSVEDNAMPTDVLFRKHWEAGHCCFVTMEFSFKLSNSTLQSIVVRYTNKRGQIEFGDFIVCVVRLKKLLSSVTSAEKKGVLHIDVEWFIRTSLYS